MKTWSKLYYHLVILSTNWAPITFTFMRRIYCRVKNQLAWLDLDSSQSKWIAFVIKKCIFFFISDKHLHNMLMVQSSVLRMESGNQTNYDSKWYKLYSTEWNMDEFLFNNKWPLFVFKSILFMRLYSSCVFKKENNPNLSLHVLKFWRQW